MPPEQNVEDMDNDAIDGMLVDDEDILDSPDQDTPPADPPADEDDTPPADEPPAQDDTPPMEETVESLKVKLAEAAEREQQAVRRMSDKESFIQRQGNELGELRKLTKTDPEELRNQFDEDPVAAVNKMNAMRDAETREIELSAEIEQEQNKSTVLQSVPDFEDMVDDIAKLAITDGAPTEIVAQFRANPYTTPAPALMNMVSRVRTNMRVTALEKELADSKKSKASMLENIANAAKT